MQELPPILVAEDDEDDFLFLRRAIRQAGLENPLLRFRDGDELVKFLSQIPKSEIGHNAHHPWLLFLDITMPVMNGFEVLQWLASHKIVPKVHPIVLSGSFRAEDMQRALALGAADYLTKPITPAAAIVAARQASMPLPA
jgi:CheY-like chemotaxis protein